MAQQVLSILLYSQILPQETMRSFYNKIATYRIGEVWDGRYKDNELPTGDYGYVVKTNDTSLDKEFVGHFTLYR